MPLLGLDDGAVLVLEGPIYGDSRAALRLITVGVPSPESSQSAGGGRGYISLFQ